MRGKVEICGINTAKLPVLKNWTQSRDLPLLRGGEFRDWWKKHEKEGR